MATLESRWNGTAHGSSTLPTHTSIGTNWTLTIHAVRGLRFYQWMMEKDRKARLRNQQRLRELRRAHSADVTIFCGHDIEEFERLSGHSARLPPEALSSHTAWRPRSPQGLKLD